MDNVTTAVGASVLPTAGSQQADSGGPCDGPSVTPAQALSPVSELQIADCLLRQAELVVSAVCALACSTVHASAERVAHQARGSRDAFVRHHLLEAVRDVVALADNFEKRVSPLAALEPCLIRALMAQVAALLPEFPDRNARIEPCRLPTGFRPSRSAEILFGLLVHGLLQYALVHGTPGKDLALSLRHNAGKLSLAIRGTGPCTKRDLLARSGDPRLQTALIAAFGGHFEFGADSLGFTMPAILCSESGRPYFTAKAQS